MIERNRGMMMMKIEMIGRGGNGCGGRIVVGGKPYKGNTEDDLYSRKSEKKYKWMCIQKEEEDLKALEQLFGSKNRSEYFNLCLFDVNQLGKNNIYCQEK